MCQHIAASAGIDAPRCGSMFAPSHLDVSTKRSARPGQFEQDFLADVQAEELQASMPGITVPLTVQLPHTHVCIDRHRLLSLTLTSESFALTWLKETLACQSAPVSMHLHVHYSPAPRKRSRPESPKAILPAPLSPASQPQSAEAFLPAGQTSAESVPPQESHCSTDSGIESSGQSR